MTKSILVVAFDGLDKELIDEFGLTNIKQEEFGSIDNQSNMSEIKTSELFASFITGENYNVHGVKGLVRHPKSYRRKFIDMILPESVRGSVRGLTRIEHALKGLLDVNDPRKHTKSDINGKTIFEEIENSRALFVPSYNPDLIFEAGEGFLPLKLGKGIDRTAEFWDRRCYSIRKEDLFSELENDIIPPRDFLMCHFHRPDIYHHLYGDREEGEFDKLKLRPMYEEIDGLAEEIKLKAIEKGYEHIIFMSDHGLPTEKGHNENAFYSCNKELFGEETPHITDFYDRILELTGN